MEGYGRVLDLDSRSVVVRGDEFPRRRLLEGYQQYDPGVVGSFR